MTRQNSSRGTSLRVGGRERNILIVTAAAHYLVHLYMLVFPSLALSLRSAFDLPLDQVLTISFWMYLLYGLAALPAGIIADLTNPRAMLALCLLGTGASAVAASRAATVEGLRLALAAMGLFAAIYHPAGMALISRGVRRRGWALGFNGVFGNLGVVTAPFLTGILAATLGWRSTYLVLAVPGLAAGLLACLLPVAVRDVPRTEPIGGGDRSRVAVCFALLCVAMMLGGIVYRGQTLVLPAYFEERISFLVAAVERLTWLPALGAGSVAATALTSLAYLAGAWGQGVGGQLADRFDLRKMYIAFHAVSLPLLLAMGQLAGWPLLVCAIGYAFFAFGMQPIENSLVAVLTPNRLRSTGYGLKFTLTFGVGALAVPVVARWQQSGGLAAVFPRLALCIVLLICFACALWLVSRRAERPKRDGRPQAAPKCSVASVREAREP